MHGAATKERVERGAVAQRDAIHALARGRKKLLLHM